MDDNEFDLKVAALKQLLATAEKGYEIAPPETKKLLLKEFEDLQTQMAELVKAKMDSMEVSSND